MTEVSELEQCIHELTQNCNESFNSTVWKLMLKNAGADPEGGFGDLSPLIFLEMKIIKYV